MLIKKLILLITVVIGIVISVITISVINITSKFVYDETLASYSRIMDDEYTTINNLFEKSKRMALDVCTNKELQMAIKGSNFNVSTWKNTQNLLLIDNLLKEYNGEYSYFDVSVYPYDDEMIYRYHYQAGLWVKAFDIHDSNWMQEVLNSKGDFSWEVIEEELGHTVRLSKVIYDLDNVDKAIGVVCVDMDLEYIETKLSDYDFGRRGTSYLINNQNKIIFPYNSDKLFPLEVLDSKGKYESVISNNLVFSESFVSNGWKLVRILPDNNILEKTQGFNRTIVIMGILLGIIAMIVTGIIAQGIVKPIKRLAFIMNKTENIELLNPIEVPEVKGEIAILYSSFNHMINKINNLIQDIYFAKAREKEAEMMALQAQINPHFLYNTLDTINWLSLKYNAKDIQVMIVSLSKMLRFSLNSKDTIIPIGHEIEQVKNYINIIKVRMPNSFIVNYEIDPEVFNYSTVRLILQPLVENAILHGFSEYDHSNKIGNINIIANKLNDEILFEISNDGKLVDLYKIEKLLNLKDSEKSKHFGVRNVHYRLQNQYGNEFGLKYSVENNMTVVRFRILI